MLPNNLFWNVNYLNWHFFQTIINLDLLCTFYPILIRKLQKIKHSTINTKKWLIILNHLKTICQRNVQLLYKKWKKSILYNSSSNELLYETECISVIFTEFFVALPCIPSNTNDYRQ